jgi:hypothetical protein
VVVKLEFDDDETEGVLVRDGATMLICVDELVEFGESGWSGLVEGVGEVHNCEEPGLRASLWKVSSA